MAIERGFGEMMRGSNKIQNFFVQPDGEVACTSIVDEELYRVLLGREITLRAGHIFLCTNISKWGLEIHF